MRFLPTIFLALILTGCATWEPQKPEQHTVVQYEYVVRIPPAETLTLPPKVEDIDLDKATQKDVALWLVRMEQRMKMLEDNISSIATFLKSEQEKVKEK